MRFTVFALSVLLTASAAAQSARIRTHANPIDIDYKYNFEQLNAHLVSRALTVRQEEYYVAIEAFDENGVSRASAPVRVP